MSTTTPRWITCRFNSVCEKCEKIIKKSERAFFYPSERFVLCETCGFPKYREMQDLMEYEDHCQRALEGGR